MDSWSPVYVQCVQCQVPNTSWFFHTSSTPGKRDREDTIKQYRCIRDALSQVQAERHPIAETVSLKSVLEATCQILDQGDIYNPSLNSLTFCEGLAFLQLWQYRKTYYLSDDWKTSIRRFEIILLDRFSYRAHQHLEALMPRLQQQGVLDAQTLYTNFCQEQFLLSELSVDLRSIVLLSYHRNYEDSSPLFISNTKILAVEKNLPMGKNGYPARPPPSSARRSLSAPAPRTARRSASASTNEEATDDTTPTAETRSLLPLYIDIPQM